MSLLLGSCTFEMGDGFLHALFTIRAQGFIGKQLRKFWQDNVFDDAI